MQRSVGITANKRVLFVASVPSPEWANSAWNVSRRAPGAPDLPTVPARRAFTRRQLALSFDSMQNLLSIFATSFIKYYYSENSVWLIPYLFNSYVNNSILKRCIKCTLFIIEFLPRQCTLSATRKWLKGIELYDGKPSFRIYRTSRVCAIRREKILNILSR